MTSLCSVIHCQPLIWPHPIFFHVILLQHKRLNREEILTIFEEVTVVKVWLMERYTTRRPFVFAMYFIHLPIKYTTENCWVVNDLRLMLNPYLITAAVFSVVLPWISSYSCYLICVLLPMMPSKASSIPWLCLVCKIVMMWVKIFC